MTGVQPRPADWERSLPAARPVPADRVQRALGAARRLVVLDDDPTGTQTVRDLPVLTRWGTDDIRWALRQQTAGFFVLTNTRSLSAQAAADRNREVATACLTAATAEGVSVAFASRGDSTLRGHFPLETDVLAEVMARYDGPVDAVLLAPAYVDAGRVTVDGIHWLRSAAGLTPVADGEFARDATFGYRSSRLAEWVEEKSGGRVAASDVAGIPVTTLRAAAPAEVASRLGSARGGRVVVLDAVVDDDLRAAVLGVLEAETAGARFLYRVGPSFVRARAGQDAHPPLSGSELAELVLRDRHGLVVVGSHVGLTSRQLARLRERRPVVHVEMDVATTVDPASADGHLAAVVDRAVSALATHTVVVATSRTLVTGAGPAESLSLAGRVSAALTLATARIVAAARPAYVVAKGGITSSDIATGALGIHRAWVRGTLLPGIVSLWQAVDGPASGLAYVVFAGNVGDDESLATVVQRLEGS
ncbi:four-carbon acid sugar kinase family protein [Nakamurella endophytica]|uniref:Four-carbon acid sugar kinase family protein n=1 Tax=Nakamurella endophytica TaxID=1748367 RepID=A0A917SRF1_9ACTN|nr:four-carbon acid sugar kinase family protein [Nakamurella endophytica]GGL94635.1 hypothetical protein GCM10011594_13060 [Nakamurella endophytica]